MYSHYINCQKHQQEYTNCWLQDDPKFLYVNDDGKQGRKGYISSSLGKQFFLLSSTY